MLNYTNHFGTWLLFLIFNIIFCTFSNVDRWDMGYANFLFMCPLLKMCSYLHEFIPKTNNAIHLVVNKVFIKKTNVVA
jgi:hypothetical protein